LSALNGKDLKSRTLTVNEARPRTGGGKRFQLSLGPVPTHKAWG